MRQQGGGGGREVTSFNSMGEDRSDDLLEDDVRDGGSGRGVGDGQSENAQGVDSRGLVDAIYVLSKLANGLVLLHDGDSCRCKLLPHRTIFHAELMNGTLHCV